MKRPLNPASPSSEVSSRVCIPNEHVGWRSALHNQQTLTRKAPRGASSSYGWTCQKNPMASQSTSSSAGQVGDRKPGKVEKETQRGKME